MIIDLRISALVLLAWTTMGCKESSALDRSSLFVPPKEIGYELVEVLGSPGAGDHITSMQGYPKLSTVAVRFQGREFHGDRNREYLVHAYDDDRKKKSGYVVYVKQIAPPTNQETEQVLPSDGHKPANPVSTAGSTTPADPH